MKKILVLLTIIAALVIGKVDFVGWAESVKNYDTKTRDQWRQEEETINLARETLSKYK